jgi:hypothetical protein
LGNAAKAYFDFHFGLHNSVVIAANLTFQKDGTRPGITLSGETLIRAAITHCRVSIAVRNCGNCFAPHSQHLSVIFSSFFIKLESLLW